MSDKKGQFLNDIKTQRFRMIVDRSRKTRQEIADELGVDQSYITKQYNGDRQITLEYVVKFAKLFNVSSDYLLGLSDVASVDANVKAICDYTGLSEFSVEVLNDYVKGATEFKRKFVDWYINWLLLRDNFSLVVELRDAFQETMQQMANIEKRYNKMYEVAKDSKDIKEYIEKMDKFLNSLKYSDATKHYFDLEYGEPIINLDFYLDLSESDRFDKKAHREIEGISYELQNSFITFVRNLLNQYDYIDLQGVIGAQRVELLEQLDRLENNLPARQQGQENIEKE